MAGNLDINDIYLFQAPTNPNNTVMILTASPAAGVMGPSTFMPFPVGLYEFLVDSDEDYVADRIIQVAFSRANRLGRQRVFVFLLDPRTQRRLLIAQGLTGTNVPVRGGGALRADLFDDPFFFDAAAFNQFVSLAMAGAPLSERVKPFTEGTPSNFFADFNTLGIVLELPSARLTGIDPDPDISVWSRTFRDGQQFDRQGLPAINTAIIPTNFKDPYNDGSPLGDPGFRELAATQISNFYGLSPDEAAVLASTVLPDVMPFDVTSAEGFLNGRRLADDVIDAELDLLTGGALTTDRVGNDSTFSNRFPYLGPPNR